MQASQKVATVEWLLSFSEHAGREVSLEIRIRQVMGSNLAGDTEYSDWGLLETVPRLGDEQLVT
jgi:hypothetical protein